ncbi:glycosyltransferase [Clostridium botulinum]|nr:glycosyltransferase [Clostridium botulinum]
MKLSIAMIVKNEEKYLDRSLSALKKLDGKLSYEVIIVDTGSEDSTIEIAKKYTNKIYEHKWENDFAQMRNISINYCKGEWILILDADEVLENTKSIIEFFKKGNDKKFNSATIKFKNIMSENENKYLIGSLVRLFKNQKGFFYEGKIHEQPVTIPPTCITNITVLHYGYSRTDYSLMEYKYKRNKQLLIKDLEEKTEIKDIIYTHFQLAQTYGMANKDYEATMSIYKAFELVKKTSNKNKYLYVYHFLAMKLLAKGNYEKAIEICEEAIEYSDKHLDFYYILCKAYSSLNKYDEFNKYFNKYINLQKKLENGYLLDDISVNNSSFCSKNEIIKDKVLCDYKNNKLDDIEKYFKELTDSLDKKEIEEVYIYSLMKNNKIQKIINHYRNKKIEDKDIQSIINIINRIDLEKIGVENYNIKQKLLGLDKKLDLYLKSKYFNEPEELSSEIDINLKKFFVWKGEIVNHYICKNKDYIKNLIELNSQDLELYINFIINDYKCLEILYEYSEENYLDNCMENMHLLNIIENVLLTSNSISDEKYKKLISITYIRKMKYMNEVYNKQILKSKSSEYILNKYEKTWLGINEAIKYFDKDKLKYIKILKKLLNDVPEYNRVIKHYLNKIEEVNINEEMIKEKDNALRITEKLIEENKIDDALEVILELNKCIKYDSDILNIKGIILYLKGSYRESIINLAISNTIKEDNFETIYNLACVLEAGSKFNNALFYYKKAYELCKDDQLKTNILDIINNIRNKR